MKTIDLATWKRKEHFDFFSKFDEPFFGIVSEIDCSAAYKTAKENNFSFFAYYLHKSLKAVNEIEEMRFRIENNNVVIYDKIHASSTIGRTDGTFAFSFVNFTTDFIKFEKELKLEINEVQNSIGLRLNENSVRKDVVHYSSIPWIKFTGLTHARNLKTQDSSPKISFGKMFSEKGKMKMPVSIHVHHGLADGLHVARYLEIFQKEMDEERLDFM